MAAPKILLPPLVRRGEGIVSPATVSRHVAAGGLVQVLPGVHLRTDVATVPAWRAAAVSAWRPNSVLLGEIAGHLTFWRELRPATIEVAQHTTLRRSGFRFVRREIPHDLVIYQGATRLTAPAMTALDLAVATDGESIDNVLRAKMARIQDLEAALALTPGRQGNRDRRRLLMDSRAEPWSVAERLSHKILHAAGITGWKANRPIVLDGHRYFLDIAFWPIRLVIEIDGRQFHIGADVFESDRLRQNALVLRRWTVLRFTYRRLVEEPDQVLAEVRAGIELARLRKRLERF